MSISEQLEKYCPYPLVLQQGSKARIKQTGQIVALEQVSDHGISMIAFRTGGRYFISNKFLEPVLACF